MSNLAIGAAAFPAGSAATSAKMARLVDNNLRMNFLVQLLKAIRWLGGFCHPGYHCTEAHLT
jgi:hypothetical protein